jgi:hypothetical protein
LAAELLDYIPPWRSDHAVYFDPADSEFPIGINLLADVPPSRRHLAIAGIVSSFKNIWRDSWGPRLEHILSNSLAAITESQNVSLLACHRILVDDHYRARIVKQVRDPMVRQFWLGEFERYDARFRAEVTAPVLNKLGALLLSPALRNVLGQVRNKIDFRFMIDDRRIFIANLAKGRIGDAASNLLGSLLISAFQLAAMSRAEIAEADRVDHCLVVDEFQNFATDSFASILSESRKYHLGISLAHQYMQQLPDEIAAAVFGNVGSWISFRVGERDANVLSREFGPPYPAATFSSLRNFEVIARVLQRGSRSDPFIGRTLPPTARRHGRRKNLIQRSRERYATRRDVVEDRINRWMQR